MTGKQKLQSNSFLCKEVIYSFFGKDKSLFGEVSTNNCKNEEVKKISQSFLNKRVCILTNGKVG